MSSLGMRIAAALLLWLLAGSMLVVPAHAASAAEPLLIALELRPGVVTGGDAVVGSVRLRAAAPAGGAVIILGGAGAAAAVPPRVTVPAGAVAATFAVPTAAVADATVIDVTAQDGAQRLTTRLTVLPDLFASLTAAPAAVVGGAEVTGTVTLRRPAPTGGLAVTFSVLRRGYEDQLDSVSIPAGAQSAPITWRTFSVVRPTTEMLIASARGVRITADVTVQPPVLQSFTIDATTVRDGDTVNGTVTLSGPAPDAEEISGPFGPSRRGVLVRLTSDQEVGAGEAERLSYPYSVGMPIGSTTATFAIQVQPGVSPRQMTVSASWNGVTRSVRFNVTRARLEGLTYAPEPVLARRPATGTLKLRSPAPAGGLVIALASSNPARVGVPASVTVPAGGTTATFPLTPLPGGVVRTLSNVAGLDVTEWTSPAADITATYEGETRRMTVPVTPLLAAVEISPVAITGGTPATATMKLRAPAPAGGVTLALKSAPLGMATVPATVSVPAGAVEATFPVTTAAVSRTTRVGLQASDAEISVVAALDLQPPTIAGIELDASQVPGGAAVTGRVLLSGPAPASGMEIRPDGGGSSPTPAGAGLWLTSSTPPLAVVPATLAVPPGQTSAAFTVSTRAVTTTTLITLSASGLGSGRPGLGEVRTATLTLVPDVLLLALRPAVLTGGAAATGTLYRRQPAPAGGAPISLSSSHPQETTLPSSVTIPAGETSVSFPIPTRVVSADLTVRLTATDADRTASADLQIQRPRSLALTLAPSPVVGGLPVTGTLLLGAPAPSGGLTVTLTNPHPEWATVPARVTLPAGATTATFGIATKRVPETVVWNVTAQAGSMRETAALTLLTLLRSFTIVPDPAVAGQGITGTLTISSPAPVGGLALVVTGDTWAIDREPFRVTVPAGAVSVTFSGQLLANLSAMPLHFWVEGDYPDFGAYLQVRPTPLAAVTLAGPNLASGTTGTGTVRLNFPAPAGGVRVTLVSANPAVLTVPASVVVPAGATTVTFAVTAAPGAAITTVTITATVDGVTRSTTPRVVPPHWLDLTLAPTRVPGGAPALGTITLLEPAPAEGALVVLTSSAPAVAVMPATVRVAAGQTRATFPVRTEGVSAAATAVITAAYAGVTRTATLQVTPPELVRFSLVPAAVVGGSTATATVAISAPAPAGGVTVTLVSASPRLAAPPAAVTIAPGQTTASFRVPSRLVLADTSVALTATYGVSRTVTLQLAPILLTALVLSPARVAGSATATATVTLNAPAPPGDALVTLASEDPTIATVPPSVRVPQGAMTATFTVTTARVSSGSSARIEAVYNGVTRAATLEVSAGGLRALALSSGRGTTGDRLTGTVTLTDPAPAGGAAVTLSADPSGHLQFPGSVTVAAGATTATFEIVIMPRYPPPGTVTLTAAYAGLSRAITLLLDGIRDVWIEPPTIKGGHPATAKVTLTAPAPPGGLVVQLASMDPGILTVPATVTVAEGRLTATFPITTAPVERTNLVTIAVRAGLSEWRPSVKVVTDWMGALTVEPASLADGAVGRGMLTLKRPAPAGGLEIKLDGNFAGGSYAYPTQGSVTVPAGAVSAAFWVVARSENEPATSTIRASYGEETVITQVAVHPAVIASVSLRPRAVEAGDEVVGTVVLAQPAPAGGAVVELASENGAVALPPYHVTVPAGQTTAPFRVVTFPVNTQTTTHITATNGGVTRQAELRVSPTAFLSITLDADRVLGGEPVNGTVRLGSAGNFVTSVRVQVRSSNTEVVIGPSPVNISVPLATLAASFTLTTLRVTEPTTVTITVTLNEVERSVTLEVLPRALVALAFDRAAVVGGAPVKGTVVLSDPAPPGGVVVALASADPAAEVPDTVQVPAGRTAATFAVGTQGVPDLTRVLITASLDAIQPTAVDAGQKSALLTLLAVRDVAVLRPKTREWFLRGPAGDATVLPFGGPTDQPVPADYLGAGHDQIAVFRPGSADWFLREDNGHVQHFPFGGPTDVPVPGDYFGRGRAQIAVYRPGSGDWFLRNDDGSATHLPFGGPEDLPVPGDYFGLGRQQLAVFRPSTREWFLRRDDGSALRIAWGGPGDRPLPGDYLGLRRSQIAVFRPGSAEWFIRRDDGEAARFQFGGPDDLPVPADYLGLGHLQLGVFRPGSAEWFLRSDDGMTFPLQWGGPEDRPVRGKFGGREIGRPE